MTARLRLVTLLIGCAGAVVVAQSPPVDAGSVFRVFLKNGQALPSYGESAEVGDRIVFTLLIGAAERPSALQLMSLPSSAVDLERTHRYADAIRLVHYAATRGEVDYAAMTQEVQRTLGELAATADPKKRLAMAEDAKRRLMTWSASTYGYRAAEIQELARLFDEVIAELRVAAGQRSISLDLRANSTAELEHLLPPPSAGESIRLALAASAVADSEDDRLAILRSAAAVSTDDPAAAELKAKVALALEQETKAGQAYETLATEVRTRGEEARRRADLDGLAKLVESVHRRDEELGARRPQLVSSLMSELEAMLASVRTYKASLDHYALVRPTLLAYEHLIRPTMSGFDGLLPVFNAIRDAKFTAFERLEKAGVRLKSFIAAISEIRPPVDLADIHATLLSALRMAEHACARRRLSVAIQSKVVADEASSAIAGAMLLAGQARDQLVVRLYPPKIQ